MKGFPLSSRIFIWTSPVYFAVTKCPSETSIYLSVFTSKPGTKYEISGVTLQVAPESKIQLVSFKLSKTYLLVISTLEDIRAKEAYIFCDSFHSVLFLMSYLFLSNCTHKFHLFLVPVNFLFWTCLFQNICDPVILQTTSEACICLSVVTFSAFIFGVAWIERWTEFLISISLSQFF